MRVPEILSHFTLGDVAALAFLFALWRVLVWKIEHPPANHPSVTWLMAGFRREWMKVFVTRTPRIFDGGVVESLRQSTAFFASASMIALGACVALLGDGARLAGVAETFLPDSSALSLQAKLVLVILMVANAFLKFVWSNRLFGYCSVLMASVPNSPDHPQAYSRAAVAAEINITAARSYNRGLESVYFAIAALAWLAGPLPLAVATAVTGAVIARREFASRSRKAILALHTSET